MRALVLTEIGKLELLDVPLPGFSENEVLLKVQAAGVCGSDLHGYTGASGRRKPPLIMGHEATGEVVAVGDKVTRVRVGDRVAMMPLEVRNGKRRLMGMDAPGAYATHTVWPAAKLYPLPDTLSYAAGAFAEPLAVALHAVALPSLRAPTSAFIAGAGPIGLLILAVLLEAGVKTLLVSDLSPERLEVARAVGAMEAVNPGEKDVRDAVDALTEGRGVDLSFEAVGVSATVFQSVAAVKNGGSVVWVGNNQRIVELDMQSVVTRELSIFGSYGMTDADFAEALRLLADGRVPTDLLTSRQALLEEGPHLFDELLASPSVVKCLIHPNG